MSCENNCGHRHLTESHRHRRVWVSPSPPSDLQTTELWACLPRHPALLASGRRARLSGAKRCCRTPTRINCRVVSTTRLFDAALSNRQLCVRKNAPGRHGCADGGLRQRLKHRKPFCSFDQGSHARTFACSRSTLHGTEQPCRPCLDACCAG